LELDSNAATRISFMLFLQLRRTALDDAQEARPRDAKRVEGAEQISTQVWICSARPPGVALNWIKIKAFFPAGIPGARPRRYETSPSQAPRACRDNFAKFLCQIKAMPC
jgi:hypothetical protein